MLQQMRSSTGIETHTRHPYFLLEQRQKQGLEKAPEFSASNLYVPLRPTRRGLLHALFWRVFALASNLLLLFLSLGHISLFSMLLVRIQAKLYQTLTDTKAR